MLNFKPVLVVVLRRMFGTYYWISSEVQYASRVLDEMQIYAAFQSTFEGVECKDVYVDSCSCEECFCLFTVVKSYELFLCSVDVLANHFFIELYITVIIYLSFASACLVSYNSVLTRYYYPSSIHFDLDRCKRFSVTEFHPALILSETYIYLFLF